jgi:hypothetical protein
MPMQQEKFNQLIKHFGKIKIDKEFPGRNSIDEHFDERDGVEYTSNIKKVDVTYSIGERNFTLKDLQYRKATINDYERYILDTGNKYSEWPQPRGEVKIEQIIKDMAEATSDNEELVAKEELEEIYKNLFEILSEGWPAQVNTHNLLTNSHWHDIILFIKKCSELHQIPSENDAVYSNLMYWNSKGGYIEPFTHRKPKAVLKYFNECLCSPNSYTAGSVNKISRICWNTENWKFPSGSQGKSVFMEAYEADAGYGHEEWLFDKSRIIDGYHYAFLQPLNLKSDRHVNKIYNISLLTVNNLNKRYYVGEISNVECITRKESLRVYNIYKAKNWLKQMRADVERVGGNHEKFMQTDPEIFFNIRFKFADVYQQEELLEIGDNDSNVTTNRYKLLPRESEISIGTVDDENETEGNKKNTSKRKKVFNSDCEYDPYHDRMQNAIFELLKNSGRYDYKKVFIEKGRVDIKAKTKQDTWHYFELKTDNPKQSIRKALGQIMEYAYFPNMEKAEKLIIVADEEPNQEVIKYIQYIRKKFNLPITYRSFNIDTNSLSNDYGL